MLRILVLVLVLANLLLLAMQVMERRQESPEAEAVQPAGDDRGDVPGIRLFSEMEREPGPIEGSAECFTAGPFESEEQVSAALGAIAPLAAAIGRRETRATVERGIWVYLPAQRDVATARNMALTLRDAGYADAAVVRDGEWNNTVSLGFFTSPANAQTLHDEARSLGFKVEMRPERVEQPRYWIDFEQRAGASYLQPGEGTGIGEGLLRHVPCGDIDQPGVPASASMH